MTRKKKQRSAGTTRRVFRNFRYTECDAFSRYLHKMSFEGWHFTKWKMGLVFEKGEPADITYCAEVFPKGSEMDLRPEKQAEEYADYCDAAGWEMIDGQRKFCVFRRRDADAPPIVTEEERFENVRKAEWRQLLLELPVPVFLTAEFWIRALGREFPDWIFFPPYLWMLAIVTLIMAGRIWQCGWMFCWSLRGKRALRQGRKVSYERKLFRNAVDWILLLLLEMGVMFLYVWAGMPRTGLILAVMLFGVLTFSAMIHWFRPSRESNWWIQIAGGLALGILMIVIGAAVIFSKQDSDESRRALARLPLTQADYFDKKMQPSRAEYICQKSVFGSWLRGNVVCLNENSEENILSYDVYRSDYAWILERIWKTEMNTGYYRKAEDMDPDQWNALEVYSNRKGTIVCARYENALLFFCADTSPTAYQKEVIVEKLNLQETVG